MDKKTLVDVIYSKKQQNRLRKVPAGRMAMFMIRGIGNFMYVEILLDRPDFLRAAGAIR